MINKSKFYGNKSTGEKKDGKVKVEGVNLHEICEKGSG